MYKAEGSFRLGVSKNNLNAAFLIMAALHMGVAITTRFSVHIALYFMIGLTASRIGASQNDGYKGSGRNQTHNSIFAASEIETEVHAKRKISLFMFSTLLSSLLYNTADASISFPAFYTSSFFSILILAILLLNTISDRSLLRRIYGYFTCRKTVIPRFSQIGKSKSGLEIFSNYKYRLLGMYLTYCNKVTLLTLSNVMIIFTYNLILYVAGISGQNSPSKFRKKYSEESIECSSQDIEVEDVQVPKNFLTMHYDNMTKAKKSYEKSLIWRKDNKVDRILVTHQNHFHEILSLYPHALHRFSIDGCAVAYELLGRAKLAEMKAKGITPEHLTWHFLLRNELLFQKYLHDGIHTSNELHDNDRNHNSDHRETNNNSSSSSSSNNKRMKNIPQGIASDVPPMGRMMTVLDVKGVSMSDITSDVISFIRQSSEIMDNYYPGKKYIHHFYFFLLNSSGCL